MKNSILGKVSVSIIVLVVLFAVLTCTKPERAVKLTTIEISNGDVTSSTASLKGEIIDIGSGQMEDHGFLISENSNPRVGNANVESLGSISSKGVFSKTVTGLTKNTTYYFKAFVTQNGVDTYAGNICQFRTLNINAANVTAGAVSNLAMTSASLNGEVTSDGGAAVTKRGLCWGTSPNPTITNCLDSTINGAGTGTFSGSMTGLSGSTQYYARTYAINSGGVAYNSSDIIFTTHNIPAVTTVSATDITSITATSGGNVTNDGGVALMTKGVCWSASSGPTILLSTKTDDGATTGTFSSSLTSLSPGTKYYVKAFATNQFGTSYGNEINFTTLTGVAATTNAATSVTTTGAVLNGSVYPDNYSTTVTFEYGTTISYGSSVPAIESPVSGTNQMSVTAALGALTPGITYHYRVKAVNTGGTVYGTDVYFTTPKPPDAISSGATSITASGATMNGTVNANNASTTVTFEYGPTTSYGSELKAAQSPVSGNSVTPVSVNLSGLAQGTTIHFRIRAVSSVSTVYSSDQSFTTLTLPTAVTNSASSVTSSAAVLNGTVNANNNSTVVSFEYGLTASYGTSVTATQSPVTGSSSTPVSVSVSGLTSNTTYHFKVKAVNSAGTVDGGDLTFLTGSLLTAPTVTTTAISSTACSSAQSGGNVLNAGGATVTSKGICWSQSANPTISDAITIDGSGTGSYTSSLTGLLPGTTYYVRAYATNSIGTGYGSQLTFTTLAQITDYDGNVYDVVTIGTQVWMQENLKVTHFRDGSQITNITDGTIWASGNLSYGAYCWFNNDIGTKDPAGALYSYYAVVDNRHLCPTGWHAASDDEWITLMTYLGGGDIAGGKVKEQGTSHWNSPNTGATNESGFTAISTGNRYGNSWSQPGTGANFWTTTPYFLYQAYVRTIQFDQPSIVRYAIDKTVGAYSVRCLQGEGVVSAAVTTSTVSGISATTATAGGYVTSNGGEALSARGVCWSTSTGPTITDNHTADGTTTGSFTSSITGLTVGLTYYVRAYATNSVGTVYGDEVSFQAVYAIGDHYQGGVIFSISGTYPNQHGLICAQADQNTSALWGCDGSVIAGADGTAVGTGNQNTTDIVNGCSTTGIAARICYDLNLNGYSDWYLPSVDELGLLATQYRATLSSDFGGAYYYWTSTEYSGNQATEAIYYNLWTGVPVDISKTQPAHVRAIRTF